MKTILTLAFFLAISCAMQAQVINASTMVSVLGHFEEDCENCEQDLNSDGRVDGADVLEVLNNLGYEAVDIVPRWYSFFNDQESGNTIIPIYPTLPQEEFRWEDIRDDCTVTWIKDGEVIAEGLEVSLNEMTNLCNGQFPLTMRIVHQGNVFERTEIMRIGTVWLDDDLDCDYGYSVIDADESTYHMNPYFNPDESSDPAYRFYIGKVD